MVQINKEQKSQNKKQYRCFKDAKELVRELNLKASKEWRKYCTSGNKPGYIPSHPEIIYKNEFKGMGDWLGTGTIALRDKVYRPFTDAREFARKLELKNQNEWYKYCKSSNKPNDIPFHPEIIYKNEFKGMGDWLGTGTIATKDRIHLPFTEV